MPTPYLLRPGGRSRRRLGALLAVPALVAPMLLTAGIGPASANPTSAGPDVAPALLPDGAEPVPVTLITGDTVHWADAGDGQPRVEIDEAPRDYPVDFHQSGTQEDFYVIPTDVMEHVVAGTVDDELFNIPGLIRQGLDDATTDKLPVIVTFDQDRSPQQLTQDADALPATSDTTPVAKVNGAGIRVDRDKAGTFRQAILAEPAHERSSRTAGARGLDGAVEQIMLDQMLEIDLAESVPQIGAPQAWDAGYTGEGVTVAVLDTGIDTSHPDLVGQVVAEANFTDEPDATDTHGHGTHVASTIAGAGAASDGARTGVAPDTDLLNGKVCRPTPDGQGVCQTSWIMAGMEWATQQGADIINMSLGGAPTDGTDPLSQLVNTLSVDTGALFVISAGNSGPRRQQVGSPGAATEALTVGAVDKSDQIASFSSRGPRVGDYAVKPEITAPGVGIVAARAEGTGIGNPVDHDYTALSGTSMSSPHVAGAAALLAQAKPNLSGSELRDALVSTASDVDRLWYEQGTGRVDIPHALDSPVYAQATVNLGGIHGQAEKSLIYTNHSDSDITLSLDAAITDSRRQPFDGVELSADTLTVPAHGQASVTVSVLDFDAGHFRNGEVLGGVVTATAPNVSLRTGVGFGPPLHRVDIEVLDSNGDRIGTDTAPDTFVNTIHDTFDWGAGGGHASPRFATSEGIATGHLPTGIHTFMTNVLENDPDTGEPLRGSVLTEVEVDIDADTTLTLDARDAVPIRVTVPHKVDKRNHEVALVREFAGSGGLTATLRAGGAQNPMYATPAPTGELAFLALFVTWTLAEPQPIHPLPWDQRCPRLPFTCYSEAPAYVYNLPFAYENGIPDDLHEQITRRDLVEVPSRYHAEYPDAYIGHQFLSLPPFGCLCGGVNQQLWIKPGKVTEYMLADDRMTWIRLAWIERRPDGQVQGLNKFSSDQFPAAEAGARRPEERWHEAPARLGAADVREEALGNPRELFATASRAGPEGDQFVPGVYLMDNSRGHESIATNFASWRMWNLDTGTELEPTSGLLFPLATEKANYRLEQTEDWPAFAAAAFQTGRATTTWTFASRPSDTQVPHGYRCPIQQARRERVCQVQPLIQLEYELGLDIHNRVAAGRAHRLTVTAGHHSKAIDRAPVTSMTMQASFDDGHTWQDARVVGKPKDTWDTGGFLRSAAPYQQIQVVLMIPPLHRTNGFATLRVRAEDANGGTVDQTIDRAYILK